MALPISAISSALSSLAGGASGLSSPSGNTQAFSSALSSAMSALDPSSVQTAGQASDGDAVGSVDGTGMFRNIADSLISNANQTDAAFQQDIVKAAAGELDNPQQLMIDSSKASIALQMVASVRNEALDAYNDIIKMSL